MKRTLNCFLAFTLMLLVTASTPAAVHNFTGDMVNPFLRTDYFGLDKHKFDNWYSIKDPVPSTVFCSSFYKDFTEFGLEYAQNDQSFLSLTHDIDDTDDRSFFKGSTLFDNGCFIGFDYSYYHQVRRSSLSPGYRLNLANNSGFITVSMDYALSNSHYLNSGVIDCEINGSYSTEQSRIYGQILFPNKNVVIAEEPYIHLSGNYQLSDHLVAGAKYTRMFYLDIQAPVREYSIYEFGFSAFIRHLKIEADYMIFDYNWDDLSDKTVSEPNQVTKLNVLYDFSDTIFFGFETEKDTLYNGIFWTPKFKYTLGQRNSIILMHRFNTATSSNDVTYLHWSMRL